jgi:hypothetical protein
MSILLNFRSRYLHDQSSAADNGGGALTPLLHSAVILNEAKDLTHAADVTLTN